MPTPASVGSAALAGREKDFAAAFETTLRYADATGGRKVHVLAGLVHQGARRDTLRRQPEARRRGRLPAPASSC